MCVCVLLYMNDEWVGVWLCLVCEVGCACTHVRQGEGFVLCVCVWRGHPRLWKGEESNNDHMMTRAKAEEKKTNERQKSSTCA